MIAEILFALFIALLLSAIFTAGFRNSGPWGSFWSFFLIVLLVVWLAGVWAEPVGPVYWGVYWAPFIFFGLIAALLLAAATPRPRGRPVPPSRTDREVGDEVARADMLEDTEAEADAAALTVFFWILLFVLAFGTVIAYL